MNERDNLAMMGSFFKTLKPEEVYLCEYGTFGNVINKLHYFIDEVYNQKSSIFGDILDLTHKEVS